MLLTPHPLWVAPTVSGSGHLIDPTPSVPAIIWRAAPTKDRPLITVESALCTGMLIPETIHGGSVVLGMVLS
jgi:hypothetical protein